MKNNEQKVIQSNANGASAEAKKQPYVVPKVKVVDLKIERGFAGSFLNGSTETFGQSDWDAIDRSNSNEGFSQNDWGTFN